MDDDFKKRKNAIGGHANPYRATFVRDGLRTDNSLGNFNTASSAGRKQTALQHAYRLRKESPPPQFNPEIRQAARDYLGLQDVAQAEQTLREWLERKGDNASLEYAYTLKRARSGLDALAQREEEGPIQATGDLVHAAALPGLVKQIERERAKTPETKDKAITDAIEIIQQGLKVSELQAHCMRAWRVQGAHNRTCR